MYEAGQKVFKIKKKRIISGVEKLDTMRFILYNLAISKLQVLHS